jgi:putative mRNA 3-end processing factor
VGEDLLQLTDSGLYCPAGDFYVDPWRPVPRAVVTHAHADHARHGSARYLAAAPGERVLRSRLGPDAVIDTLPYGAAVEHGGVRVSLHPAGHVLGSAQVRLEHRGQVCVVSGDYKLEADPTCAAFEPVRCHLFVTESTFGLPIYRWPAQAEVFTEVNTWWRANAEAGRPTLLFGYALGKAQRLLAGLDPSVGPIYTHGAVEKITQDYRDSGVSLPPTNYVGDAPRGTDWKRALVLAPPSAHGTPWARKFGSHATGFASGWMRIRGTRRRRAVDRGFVLSDHADWPGLLRAVEASGAEQVWVTHGYVAVLVRYLREKGLEARGLQTLFEGERDDTDEEVASEAVSGEPEAPAAAGEGGP